ncbi:hypothetical protein HPT25_12335 [Bacillus sp. BRMEA1]|uniref:hypothetical protein n=1 Tax=Neobacillus endophyticus TaxID=2738405 RepID=UPI0015654B41|nr:hypothetical protein [Neobacillus endophyticus]NRD78175.1 hypothetical protein [Neobacillus endophyticus]
MSRTITTVNIISRLIISIAIAANDVAPVGDPGFYFFRVAFKEAAKKGGRGNW